jgi:hypothetical protein
VLRLPSMCGRRARGLIAGVVLRVRVGGPRLTSAQAASIARFRIASGQAPPIDTSPSLLPIATGCLAELHIDEVFPCTKCFVQLDLQVGAIRWSHDRFLSLYVVESVRFDTPSALASEQRKITITYNDSTDMARMMTLRPLPQGPQHLSLAAAWVEVLEEVLKTIPRFGRAANWRWAVSCIAATSTRGKSGILLRSELRILLRCANASAQLSNADVDACIEATRENSPQWLLSAPPDPHRSNSRLNAQQITMMLLQLCTSTPVLIELFSRYACSGCMEIDEWLTFVRIEQLGLRGDRREGSRAEASQVTLINEDDEMELESTKEGFIKAQSDAHCSGMTLMQFGLQLLHMQNDAVKPGGSLPSKKDLHQPLPHYWAATSHNSCQRWHTNSRCPLCAVRTV